jgi:hypothetical protein
VERPYRDGKNALELKAVARVEQDLAALPASILVKLFLFPDTIAR